MLSVNTEYKLTKSVSLFGPIQTGLILRKVFCEPRKRQHIIQGYKIYRWISEVSSLDSRALTNKSLVLVNTLFAVKF